MESTSLLITTRTLALTDTLTSGTKFAAIKSCGHGTLGGAPQKRKGRTQGSRSSLCLWVSSCGSSRYSSREGPAGSPCTINCRGHPGERPAVLETFSTNTRDGMLAWACARKPYSAPELLDTLVSPSPMTQWDPPQARRGPAAPALPTTLPFCSPHIHPFFQPRPSPHQLPIN